MNVNVAQLTLMSVFILFLNRVVLLFSAEIICERTQFVLFLLSFIFLCEIISANENLANVYLCHSLINQKYVQLSSEQRPIRMFSL